MIFGYLSVIGDMARIHSFFASIVHMGEGAVDKKARELAAKLASLMRLGLTTNIFGLESNSPETADLKDSDTPGVDTGSMRKAITYKRVDDTSNKGALSYFVGIPTDAGSGAYPGPVSLNFDEGAWVSYYNPLPMVSLAYVFIHGQIIKMPPHASRLAYAPPRDFITPAFEQMKGEIREEFEDFVHKFLMRL